MVVWWYGGMVVSVVWWYGGIGGMVVSVVWWYRCRTGRFLPQRFRRGELSEKLRGHPLENERVRGASESAGACSSGRVSFEVDRRAL
jgi:hypothetical protein